VNYTVVVAVANPEEKLLPGMTARVEFLTASAENVLKVANAALRFKPAEDVAVAEPATGSSARTAQGGADRGAQRAAAGGNAQRAGRAGRGSRTGSGSGTLYYLDAAGTMKAMRVRTGLTDGTTTVVRGPELKDGMKVIAGTAVAQSTENGSSNPFQGSASQSGARRPGGF
jgi:HlyD family secretion protein